MPCFRLSCAAFALLFALFLPAALPAAAQDREQALSDQKAQAQPEYEDAQTQLDDIPTQQHETDSQIGQLEGQAATVAAQLQQIYASLQDAERELLACQAASEQAAQALDAKQAEYDACFVRSKDQMRAMQMLDGGGAIGLLAQAKSLYQLLTFSEVLQQIVSKNSQILTDLRVQAQALEEARRQA